MAPILTAEDVVGRIAAECTFVDERGAVGIRPPTGRRNRAVWRAIPPAVPTEASAPAAGNPRRFCEREMCAMLRTIGDGAV